MKKFVALVAVFLFCGISHGDFVTYQGQTATVTGYLNMSDGTNSLYENAYIGQMRTSYVAGFNPNGPSAELDTFCVNAFNNETNSQYAVTKKSIDSVFSAANANEMAYLYFKYGTKNLSGQDTLAAGLALAEWDLSLNQHTSLIPSGGSPYFGTGNVGTVYFLSPSGVSADVTNVLTSLLNEAVQNAGTGNAYVSKVNVLYNPTGDGYQQSVLVAAPTPEPSSVALFAIGFFCLIAFNIKRILKI